ncbi:transposase [Bacillus sp. ISL-45]|uniref:transposase n=1 Tax=Bacillus sp. ISL-45 TaxID=2819128 RepID=UPI001BE681F9|nr:transposase [Bacillus sp. ISL-45]MBT2661744.1 transposase [Bacillus sp. ISL-45]
MSRKPRIWYPGAVYHITDRGNRKMPIFSDDKDRFKFMDLLEETRISHAFTLHAYCLMTTHYHLLLETINHHPQEIMKLLNSRYGIYFNKRHDLVGHVFQGRYKSELIDTDEYFLNASRYIHLNPYEGNIVQNPAEYKWSSYQAYISNRKNPHITTHRILSYFPDPPKEHYKKVIDHEISLKQNPEAIM